MKDTEIVEALKKDNEEYKKLDEEHRSLEKKLAEIDKNRYLTTEDGMERKKIQKQKLARKDRMAEIIREYRNKV